MIVHSRVTFFRHQKLDFVTSFISAALQGRPPVWGRPGSSPTPHRHRPPARLPASTLLLLLFPLICGHPFRGTLLEDCRSFELRLTQSRASYNPPAPLLFHLHLPFRSLSLVGAGGWLVTTLVAHQFHFPREGARIKGQE